ncbi:MAG: class I SAM-dependent methyltransferase [Anaerolineae bacterium]|nr:class I SAM-dependent methyltransferase [Anaerolineae bacterium]
MSGFYALIARYYDSEHADKTEDFDFYHQTAQEAGGPILIIGAGTGRIALNLAEAGFDVHGIEQEQAMLERATRRYDAAPKAVQQRTRFIRGDALTIELDQQYRMIAIPYNTLMHFHSVEAHLGLLRRCREWLMPGGVLAIDLPNAGEAYAAQDTGAVVLERTFLERETGHLIMQHSVSELDRVEQLMHVTWIYDEVLGDHTVKRTVAPVINRFFFLSEMRLLLEKANFGALEVYGDLDYSDYVDGCPRMVILAK